MAILDEMFSDVRDPASKAERLESLKSAMSESIKRSDRGETRFDRGSRTLIKRDKSDARRAEVLQELMKGATADQAAALGTDIDSLRAEINKEWTPSNPINGGPTGAQNSGFGLTSYDLEGPAKRLVPQYTPLRNSIPRKPGHGTAHQFKRILSYTNAGIPGGAANQSPFFSSAASTQNLPGTTTQLLRPPTISYTGDSQAVAYVELGFSDYVAYLAQFESLGFDDPRSLQHMANLWSHLMGEERADLYARGASSNGYAGALAAPTVGTVTQTGTGGAVPAATYYVYVCANSGFGWSVPSTVQSVTTTGTTSVITVPSATSTGAVNYGLFVGTTTGIANATLQATWVGGAYTLTNYTTSGQAGVATDTSANANGYDGLLTVQSNPALSGYVSNQAGEGFSADLSELDLALYTMYVNNGADPEEAWMTAAIRAQLNQILRGGQTGYRVNLVAGDNGTTLGTLASGYMNPNTGRIMSLNTHRFMPAGNFLIRSTSINVPNSGVSAPAVKVNVQDYMAIDWPSIQMTYDTSTYQVGTLVHYAPAWSGLIQGVGSDVNEGS